LNHRAVGQRLRERHADLEHVSAGDERRQQLAVLASDGSPAVMYVTRPCGLRISVVRTFV
jgi:hypothetical protein